MPLGRVVQSHSHVVIHVAEVLRLLLVLESGHFSIVIANDGLDRGGWAQWHSKRVVSFYVNEVASPLTLSGHWSACETAPKTSTCPHLGLSNLGRVLDPDV